MSVQRPRLAVFEGSLHGRESLGIHSFKTYLFLNAQYNHFCKNIIVLGALTIFNLKRILYIMQFFWDLLRPPPSPFCVKSYPPIK